MQTVLSAFSGGITESIPTVSVFSVSDKDISPTVSGFLSDLNNCAAAFSGMKEMTCLKTVYSLIHWRLSLPGTDLFSNSNEMNLLVSALYGNQRTSSPKNNAEIIEWTLRTMLASRDERCSALFDYTNSILEDSDPDIRLVLLCDFCDPYSFGVSSALLQWFRETIPNACSVLIGLTCTSVDSREINLSFAKSALASLSEKKLLRTTDGRATRGADAMWILGLPASFVLSAEAYRLLSFAAARIAARCFRVGSSPASGLHTVAVPATLALNVLGTEATAAASFLLSSLWCLSDLFPSLKAFTDHPALLRSLKPAVKNNLFRRLFRNGAENSDFSLFPKLERVLKTILLEILILIRTLPDPLRLSDREKELWNIAHTLCGRAVTLAAEYDVSRQEAEASGIDKVHPVHRVSMADTEEERLQRQLDEMAVQLEKLLEERDSALAELSAFRSRQILEDCAARCATAKSAADEKSAASVDSRSALFARERRSRLLQAAVDRCRSDLRSFSVYPSLAAPAVSRVSLRTPFAGELLDPTVAESCFKLFSDHNQSEDTTVAVRDMIPDLFSEFHCPDTKSLTRSLSALTHADQSNDTIAVLFSDVCKICTDEISSWRILSDNVLPDVPLLPDCAGEEQILTISDLASRILAEGDSSPVTSYRGILAMLLLRQYRRIFSEESTVEYVQLHRGTDPALDVWLDLQNCTSATLACLRKSSNLQVVAILLPGHIPVPVSISRAAASLIPSFVSWFNRGTFNWMDPCPYLSESDRLILTEQLTRCRSVLHDDSCHELNEFLRAFYQDIIRSKNRSGNDSLLSARLKTACALSSLNSWKDKIMRTTSAYDRFVISDTFCSVLTGKEPFVSSSAEIPDEVVYTYNGKPFARESSSALMESAGYPEEDLLLNTLDTECQILFRSSDDYRDALTSGLNALLLRYPDASPDARSAAENLLHEAELPLTDSVTHLVWPWDPDSPTVRTIFIECLGDRMADAALEPFSDCLSLFPARGGEIIGDSLLSDLCVIDETSADPKENNDPVPASDAVLPPLSYTFAKALCLLPEGRTLFHTDFLKFTRAENGDISCIMTLQGAFTLQLTRVWSGSEICRLYSHDLPTLALWPSVPFVKTDWHAYFAYAHFRDSWRIGVITNGTPVWMCGSGHRYISQLDTYPVCFVFELNGVSAGALPNLLPELEPSAGDAATVCLDFGSSSVSVLTEFSGNVELFHGPSAVRLLLSNPSVSAGYLNHEFLSADAFTHTFPSNILLFGNKTEISPIPFNDGIICRETDPTRLLSKFSGQLLSAFNFSETDTRATEIYLHELMLLIAFRVRIQGSSALNWRFSVPDDIPPDVRTRLVSLLHMLADKVSQESGLFSFGMNPVLLTCTESTAIGSYCRNIAPSETGNGFMALDLGSRSVCLSLFIGNTEEALRSCRIADGLLWALLPSLLRNPSILSSDFAELTSEPFRSDLSAFIALLSEARRDSGVFTKVLPVMDSMIHQYGSDLRIACVNRMIEGRPTRIGALVLYYFCRIMMFTALDMLPSSSFSGQRILFPERMNVFLTGTGTTLFEALSDYSQSVMRHFLGMFRNPRIQGIQLIPSFDRKLEIVSGLSSVSRMTSQVPDPAPASSLLPVSPEDLLPEFLLRFLREFPLEAALLFPDFYTGDPYTPFTPRGQQLLSEAISRFRSDFSAESPYQLLSSWLSELPELILDR